MQKKDKGLDGTLAATMQYMMTMGQQQHVSHNPFMFQQGAAEFSPQGIPG